MPIQYTNRRGDVYHLQTKPLRNGAPGYSMTRKLKGSPVDRIPDGYEIYENPDNAQVFIRKIKPSSILATEKQTVESAIRQLSKAEHFIVDVDGDSLVIYLPDMEMDDGLNELVSMSVMGPRRAKEWLIMRGRFSKMTRFTVKPDQPARVFDAERWCFRGSIDNWFPLDYAKPLGALLKTYVRHLGQESFFELM